MYASHLAWAINERGGHDDRRALFVDAVARSERLGYTRFAADARCGLAVHLHEQGDLENASREYERALSSYRKLGVRRSEVWVLVNRAALEVDEGRFAAARTTYVDAIAAGRLVLNVQNLAQAFAGLGAVAAREGRCDEALDVFARAEALGALSVREAKLLDLKRAHLDLAEGRIADARRRLHAAAPPPRATLWFAEVRIAARTLERALAEFVEDGRSSPSTANGPTILIDATRRAFVTEDGEVSLERRRSLWLLFERLVRAHDGDGRAVAVQELVEAGWPEERVRPEAGARRVYTAMSTLRHAGLKGLIVNRDDGYLLRSDVRVERSP
jgi:tetratricopeptide (TPR) repeat protein